MRIFKSFKKVFSKPIKFYQKAMLSLGMVLAANQYLMAAIDPMEGINSVGSFFKKAISVAALIVGVIVLLKGIWDFKKAYDGIKTGQKDIIDSVMPIIIIIIMLVGVAFLFYFGF
ncbi:hypothetical protein KVE62_04610 [Helicobacter pylori]|nr:hypothetical protein KVE62_04610 [Helicobacter pylori]